MRALWFVLAASLFQISYAADSKRQSTPRTAAEVEEIFAATDRDDDGRISRSEAQRRPQLQRRFAGVDASGDGYLSRAEYRARPSSERFE